MVMDKNGHSHKAAGRPDGGQYETKPGAGTDDDLEAINIRLAKTLPDLDEDTRRRLIQATLQAVDAHDRSDTGDETACWWDDPDKYEERFYDFDWDDEQAGKAIDRVRDGSRQEDTVFDGPLLGLRRCGRVRKVGRRPRLRSGIRGRAVFDACRGLFAPATSKPTFGRVPRRKQSVSDRWTAERFDHAGAGITILFPT